MGFGVIIASLGKSLGQLDDTRFLRVVLTGVGAAIALLLGLSYLGSFLMQLLIGDSISLPFIGEISWAGNVLGWTSFVGLLVLSSFMMIPIAMTISGFFLDTIADAVEQRHYPGLPPARRLPFLEALTDAMKFLGLVLAVNLVGLVIYLLFLPFAPFVFLAINGFLLGREYFNLVAARRTMPEHTLAIRRRNRFSIWVAGILIAVPLSIPIVNLFVPVIGVAVFTHLFQNALIETG